MADYNLIKILFTKWTYEGTYVYTHERVYSRIRIFEFYKIHPLSFSIQAGKNIYIKKKKREINYNCHSSEVNFFQTI